jgi:biotin synthase
VDAIGLDGIVEQILTRHWRRTWSLQQARDLHDSPLLDLVFAAARVHRAFHAPGQIQVCKLISIKTGGCPEDCAYCSQSSHYQTGIASQPMLATEQVLEIARRAREAGASRVCMGAAWREVRDSKQFDRVLEMVKGVTDLGLEVCCTLGMLTADQARRLEEAGLYAYNHNLDTSEDYYETIITTRKYQDRLDTIANIRKTSVTVCSGGIVGLGESVDDRVAMLCTLSGLDPHPESVPINLLSPVQGTPLADAAPVPVWDVIRMIAVARILMPRSDVRLSAGRVTLSAAEQALCFLAGANSIFSTDDHQMLTKAVPSPDYDADRALLDLLGLTTRPVQQRPAQTQPRDQKASEGGHTLEPVAAKAPAEA